MFQLTLFSTSFSFYCDDFHFMFNCSSVCTCCDLLCLVGVGGGGRFVYLCLFIFNLFFTTYCFSMLPVSLVYSFLIRVFDSVD